MKISRLLTLFIAVWCTHLPQVNAQSDAAPIPLPPESDLSLTPPPPIVVPTVTYLFQDGASHKSRSANGRFERIGLHRREKVEIELQFPTELANAPITAQSLDGADLSVKEKDAVIGPDGKLSLRLKVEDVPGLYRVLITAAGTRTTIRFWVYEPEDPNGNNVMEPGN